MHTGRAIWAVLFLLLGGRACWGGWGLRWMLPMGFQLKTPSVQNALDKLREENFLWCSQRGSYSVEDEKFIDWLVVVDQDVNVNQLSCFTGKIATILRATNAYRSGTGDFFQGIPSMSCDDHDTSYKGFFDYGALLAKFRVGLCVLGAAKLDINVGVALHGNGAN